MNFGLKQIIICVIIVVLLSVGYFAFNELDKEAKERKAKAIIPPTGITKEFTMRSYSWGWDPDTITVDGGDHVKLVITVDPDQKDQVPVPHAFGIQEFGVDVLLPVGIPTVVEFEADKRGTFKFICSIPCGEGHFDMIGQLIVK